MTHIVKRRGHKEEFDSRKVYASCYAACLNAHLGKQESEKIAEQVSGQIDKWIDEQPEVTSQKIFEQVVIQLKKLHQDAAFLYETHRDLA